MITTIESNNLVFTNCGDYLLVGTNQSNVSSNAVVKGKHLNEDLVIPYSVNNISVKIVGDRAFCLCLDIKNVQIDARITHIHQRAFSNCRNIVSINIPNTCEYIGVLSLDFHNSTTNSFSNGTVIVRFEQGSRLKFIDVNGISQKEQIIIYFCETKAPKFNKYIYQSSKVIVYSPTKINFGGVMSKRSISHCSCVILNTMKTRRQFALSYSMSVLMLCIS